MATAPRLDQAAVMHGPDDPVDHEEIDPDPPVAPEPTEPTEPAGGEVTDDGGSDTGQARRWFPV